VTSDRQGTERETRENLAACYRLVAKYGLTDLIYNHISARVPGPQRHFLINRFGLLYTEVTASNLVKVDIDGRIVDPADAAAEVNPAGFVIHGAIHAAREDAACVLHTHSAAGIAVSACAGGLLPISQYAISLGPEVAYHDYEGYVLEPGERERLVRNLGGKRILFLRNHGLLTVGRTIAEAFALMFNLDQACRIQLAAQAASRELVIPPPEVRDRAARQFGELGARFVQRGGQPVTGAGARAWVALLRQLDREDPSYRD
jgi:ribulose-5-phosphate 4-epimerase/fuculose-1-phosphate aldolase